MSLVEVLVAMIVAGIILTAFLAVMSTASRTIVRETNRSSTNDQAKASIEEIDRELRSATVLYNPATETDATGALIPYYGLRFETQANAPTRGGRTCVQYRISNAQLLRRTWPSGNTGAATGWWVVATGVVNVANTAPAFQLSSDPNQGGGATPAPLGPRSVDIMLLLNTKTTDGPIDRLTSSVAIRNQSAGDPCSPTPAG